MKPHTQRPFDRERPQELPTQEHRIFAGEYLVVLSAEQVYAQRLAEYPPDKLVPGPVLIP